MDVLIVNTSAPFFPHIFPLLSAVCRLCTGRRTIGLPSIRSHGSATYRASLEIRPWPLCQQRSLQRRIKGQNCLAEVAAISPRPAFSKHIALAIQRQAAAVHHFDTSLRIAAFSVRVSSRPTASPPVARWFELLPVAEHAADPAPVRAAVTTGALRRQAWRHTLEVAFFFHKSLIGVICKSHSLSSLSVSSSSQGGPSSSESS